MGWRRRRGVGFVGKADGFCTVAVSRVLVVLGVECWFGGLRY